MMITRNAKSLTSVDIEDLMLKEMPTPSKAPKSPSRSKTPERQIQSEDKSQQKSRSRSRSKSPSRGRPPKSKDTPVKSKGKQTKSKSPSGSRSQSSSTNARSSSHSPPKRPVRKVQEKASPKETSTKSVTKIESKSVSKSVSEITTRLRTTRSEAVVEEKEEQIVKEHKEKLESSSSSRSSKPFLKWVKVKQTLKKVGCFGAQFLYAASIVVLLNGLVLYTHLNCSKGPKGCLMNRLPALPPNILTLFNACSFATVSAFVLFQFAIALVPLGKVCVGSKYRANGLLCLVANIVFFCASAYFLEYPVSDLYTKQTQLAFSAAMLAAIVCVALYLKTFVTKPTERSAGFLSDLIYGREVQPKVGKLLYVKNVIVLRLGHYLAVMMYLSYVLTDYSAKSASSPASVVSSLNWPLVLLASMHLCYVIITQLLEEDLLQSMSVKRDTLSYAKLMHHLVMTPFVMTLPGRFLLEHEAENRMPLLCASGLLVPFVIGAAMFYQTNHQKGLCKRNPDHPSASHLLSITSGRGEREVKLICSGLFRFMRHPNYFGDLLIHLAMAFLTGFVSAVPYVPFMYLLAYSVIRIMRMEKMLHSRSSSSASAWNQYTKEVPKRLLVKLF